ncbi:MAG: family 10 glycosylhydrolase [Candidatus Aureabacteria bacterium]|nr:family 10 glycosylhydrolase [Candidatus Auribacterota bacterium]
MASLLPLERKSIFFPFKFSILLFFFTVFCTPAVSKESSLSIKGIWVSDPTLYEWETVITRIKKIGITDIFVNFASAGVAFYPSKYLPVKQPKDSLENLVRVSHEAGIRVHAKILTFFMHWAPPEQIKKMIRRGRCLKNLKGKIQYQAQTPWLDPSQQENRELVQDIIREVLEQFNVDGIQLDYIRFYEEKKVPRTITRIRKNILNNFVKDISILIKQKEPAIALSACVFYDLYRAKKEMAQDWETWAKKGIFSFLVPMNYTLKLESLYQWLNTQTRILGETSTPFYSGLAAYLPGMTPTHLYKEIKLVESFHVPGYILFGYTDDFAKTMIKPLSRQEELLSPHPIPSGKKERKKKKT